MKKKVLIIDDEVDQVAALSAALELGGYEVASANTGAEGLARAREEKPCAIVLDVTMETAGAGFKVARQLREAEDTKDIPIVMLTGINRAELGLRYGADEDWNPVDAFLDKPVTGERLAQEIERVLAG